MLEFDFESLSALGLTPALAGRVADSEVAGYDSSRLVRVTTVHRETVIVHDGRGESRARVLPRLAKSLAGDESALAVGDWVLSAEQGGEAWIVHRIEPTSHIAGRDADGRRHPVVSNVDIALLVMGLDADFNPRRIERYLALVHGGDMVPVVVLTKVDLVPVASDGSNALRERLPRNVDVVSVNATHPCAAHALRHYTARGQTLVLLGSSGAGKSTLVNTLLGTHVQDTGATREHDGRGRHTTTSRSLHRLPGGACIIDTPGLRALRPDADEVAIAQSFADIETLAEQCRFRDCRHVQEPGCAVRAHVEPDRLRNYQKLLREIRRDSRDALDRQRQVAAWKARGRLAPASLRAKRGEA